MWLSAGGSFDFFLEFNDYVELITLSKLDYFFFLYGRLYYDC